MKRIFKRLLDSKKKRNWFYVTLTCKLNFQNNAVWSERFYKLLASRFLPLSWRFVDFPEGRVNEVKGKLAVSPHTAKKELER